MAGVLRRLLVAAILLLPLTAFAGDVPISDTAKRHFEVGVALLDDPEGARYEDAYRAFKAAYADSPSPKILGNIGLCAMKLERDAEAIDAYGRYLSGVADIDPQEREQIERDLKNLEAAIVKARVNVTPAGATVIDTRTPVQGAPVVNRYGPTAGPLELGIRPGQHEITVQLDGYDDASWTFEAAPGAQLDREIALSKTAAGEEPSTPIPDSVWHGVAITSVLVVGAVVTGSIALAKDSEFKDINDGGDLSQADEVQSTGLALAITTDVLLGGALIGATVTSILFFTAGDEAPDTAVALTPTIRVTPAVGPRGFALSGTF